MSVKRKHVVFEQDALPEPALSTGPVIHPDRLLLAQSNIAPPATVVKKPKAKSEKKKNYLVKKARRQRKLSSARKASAPKDRHRKVEEGEDLTPSSGEESGAAEPGRPLQPIAGPSRSPKLPVAATITGDGDSEAEAADKARRQKEKKMKRAARDDDKQRRLRKKAKRLAREEAARPDSDLAGIRAEDEAVLEPPYSDRPDVSREIAEEDRANSSRRTRSPSIPPLEAFPLPLPAPVPDPKLLSRQGLPAGLENATFVDQDLRIGINELLIEGVQKEDVLSEGMRKKLGNMAVEDFFAVQAALLPHLLPLRLVPPDRAPRHDYLVSAPTGSGKTLAYAVPLVEILSKRFAIHLRALIVLPTKDLVGQVRETMELLVRGTGLRIGALTGQHSFSHEQNLLIRDQSTPYLGGSSKLDILITTPGRLIDHLKSTPNFTLQHLRFLVIDEADRLLNQSFHDWLAQVLSHIHPPDTRIPWPEGYTRKGWDHVAFAWQEAFGLLERNYEGAQPRRIECQKLLFSATLTRDPGAIASLNLNSPKYFIVQSPDTLPDAAQIGESFALPTSLEEKILVVPTASKPLHLIHLMHGPATVRSALVFTKSVESVARLALLMHAFEAEYKGGVVVKGLTGEMKPSERRSILSEFSAGKIHLLICSDLISRGMDLPSVSHVVSYDTPLAMRKYVHRVGRTARAGRQGTAWTLVEKQEAVRFKGMMDHAGRGKIQRVRVKDEDLEGYKVAYERAMTKLRESYGKEASA